MSIFTYHIPQDSVYNASDMINILNNNYRHSVLAQNHGSFYSLGTIFENYSLPAALIWGGVQISPIAGIAPIVPFGIFSYAMYDIFLKSKPTGALISSEPSDLIINGHFALDSSNHWYYYQEEGTANDIFREVFTPKEVTYLLNTNDVWNTLNHNVPDSYIVPLNGESSHHNHAVLDA